MPRISHVVLVPDRATRAHGRFTEREMIDGYVQSLFEQLEEDRAYVSILQNGDPIMPGTLVIHCLGGFLPKPTSSKSNTSSIFYGTEESLQFAEMLHHSLMDWGRCYANFYHKGSLPKPDASLLVEGTLSVSVSPFRINGPEAESYMMRLDELGRTIAHCVREFMISRGEQTKIAKVDYK